MCPWELLEIVFTEFFSGAATTNSSLEFDREAGMLPPFSGLFLKSFWTILGKNAFFLHCLKVT